MEYEPNYLKLYESGELDERIEKLYKMLESCKLCPRKCGKNRLNGEIGYCKSGKDIIVSAAHPHFGEEGPLVGIGGSGTIFLTNCNLGCVYCQNYEISHMSIGNKMTEKELAKNMVRLQNMGCHNINWVTPTHFTPQLIKAIKYAIEKGLHIPIVYNCGGYENKETIKLLDGIVDIYMPDIKYGKSEPAERYSNAPDYFDRCKEAVKEMHRQVGDLKLDNKGTAYRGLLIRHLVLPNDLAGSEDVLKFVAENISVNSYVNIMPQYRPMGEARRYKELNRPITKLEFGRATDIAKSLGLTRGIGERERF